jgi:hypothetical protein
MTAATTTTSRRRNGRRESTVSRVWSIDDAGRLRAEAESIG